jgi:hypothetical protein
MVNVINDSMKESDKLLLENCDPEDIGDMIPQIGRSFGVVFERDAFLEVKTFGEFCEVVAAAVKTLQRDDCTSQQAFYKLRAAMVTVLDGGGVEIAPATRIDELFPRKGRRRRMRELRRVLGVKLGMLDWKPSVGIAMLIGYLLCVAGIFVNWRYGVAGLLGCVVANWVAWRLANELVCDTVGEAAWLFEGKYYHRARRDPDTVNRAEIVPVVQEIFRVGLGLPMEALAPEAVMF